MNSNKNIFIRKLFRTYPFKKGRWRLMMLAEAMLDRRLASVNDFLGKHQFHFDLSNRDLESSFYYFMPEAYESETQRFIRDFLKPGMTVLDVGAHYGLFTLLFADCVGAKGRVFAFEPVEYNFLRLKQNIEYNRMKQVSLHNLAASDRGGQVEMVLDSSTAGHHLSHPDDEIGSSRKKQMIQTTTLDEFLNLHDVKQIDLVKIDAEKSEDLVLAGAKRLITTDVIRNVICEIHSTNKRGRCGQDRVRKIFYSHGFRSYILNSKLSNRPYLSEITPAMPVTGLQNLLFRR